jgi:hypothetical protein
MSTPDPHERTLVAIAGASGFVGTRMRVGLGDLFRWRALTRSASASARAPRDDATEWRRGSRESGTDSIPGAGSKGPGRK